MQLNLVTSEHNFQFPHTHGGAFCTAEEETEHGRVKTTINRERHDLDEILLGKEDNTIPSHGSDYAGGNETLSVREVNSAFKFLLSYFSQRAAKRV